MLIGLTGTYCAGKNRIAAFLENRGLPVLDVDKLGYKVLEAEKETIFAQFGSDLRQPNGDLNRRLLGQRVFGNPEKLTALEAIIHPPVNRMTGEWLEKQTGHCVINAAILHKSAFFNQLDRIILVTAPFFTRILRAHWRDKLSLKEILRRFSSQKKITSQYLAGNAEIYKVENPGFFDSQKLSQKLECRLNKILEGIC